MSKIGRDYEKFLASQLTGFDVVRGSGSVATRKGDLISQHFLVECKSTRSEGFRVSTGLFEKISKEASTRHRYPAMLIRVQDKDFVVLEGAYWMEMLDGVLQQASF